MNLIRVFLRWLRSHRVLSFIGLLLVICAIQGVRFVLVRSEGVTSAPLRRGTVVDVVYGIGTVTATKSYAVKPGLTGHISELYVREGDRVSQGQRLVKLDFVTFKAPFSGVINYLPFKVGENVFSSMPVLVETDLADRYMLVNLEQQAILKVHPGQKVKISFDTLRTKSFEGIVGATYSYNGNFIARVDTPDLPLEILPDMTADVGIVIREITDVLLLPAAAYEDGFVWVRRSHSVPTQIPIQIGIVDQAYIQVVSGDLAEGDQVMIRRKLTP